MSTKIKLEDTSTWPPISTAWRHHSGRIYVVVDYTNVEFDQQDRFPTTVVYVNMQSNMKYSRPLMDWERSFEPLSV